MADLQTWNRGVDDLRTFSFFYRPIMNTMPSRAVNVVDMHRYVTSDFAKEQTLQLRAMSSSAEAKKFKATHFDYCTFSGLFNKRNEKDLITFSELMCIDFDDVENVNRLKRQLLENEYFDTELMFTSPSGHGVKWIIPVDLQGWKYSRFFQSVVNCLDACGLPPVDKSGSDIARSCFLCYDPDAFIHPKYELHVKENILRTRLGDAPF